MRAKWSLWEEGQGLRSTQRIDSVAMQGDIAAGLSETVHFGDFGVRATARSLA
ncbi:MAG: hypothetical protein ACP5O0_04730 [Acidimicrobiales bacterium]